MEQIEHRLFSQISINRRGKPPVGHEVIINLISATTTRTGLKVYARLDEGSYPKGIKVHRQAARRRQPPPPRLPPRVELQHPTSRAVIDEERLAEPTPENELILIEDLARRFGLEELLGE